MHLKTIVDWVSFYSACKKLAATLPHIADSPAADTFAPSGHRPDATHAPTPRAPAAAARRYLDARLAASLYHT